MTKTTQKKILNSLFIIMICSSKLFAQGDGTGEPNGGPGGPSVPINNYLIPFIIISIVSCALYFFYYCKKTNKLN